jgi:hypothetical protein
LPRFRRFALCGILGRPWFLTYAHVIPGSQRRVVERVAGVLFSDVLKLEDGAKDGRVNQLCSQDL